MRTVGRTKKMVGSVALVLAGFAAGGAVAATGSASAATDAVSSGVSQAASQLDPTKSIRPDEHLLTGATAGKVRAAALTKYPSATIQRVETDSEGVYEAHIITASGDQVIVQVGKDFTVTGTQTGGPGGTPPSPGGTPPSTGGPGA